MATITSAIRFANEAGGSRSMPILRGLCARAVIIPWAANPTAVPTVKIRPENYGTAATATDVSSSLTPQAYITGSAGTLSDMGRFSDTAVSDWDAAGIAKGDYILIIDSTGTMKTGVYEIESVGTGDGMSADNLIRLLNPYRDDGSVLWPYDGQITSLSWRIAWRLDIDTAQMPIMAGRSHVRPPDLDLSAVPSEMSVPHILSVYDGTDTYYFRFYVRDVRDGDIIWFDGVPWDGYQTAKKDRQRIGISFIHDIGMVNRGGIGTVEITTGNFYWDPDHTEQGEITVSKAQAVGVYVTSGTGTKTGTFRLRAARGDTIYRDVAVSITVVAATQQFVAGKEVP